MKYWDRAWTLVEGCTPCSPGCDNCWSAAMAHRFNPEFTDQSPVFNGIVHNRPDRLELPLHRRKPTVYCVWNDLFHKDVPPDFINRAYAVMAASPRHTFLVLTKRGKRMADFFASRYFPGRFHDAWIEAGGGPPWSDETAPPWPLPNVWHGLTVCNQNEADRKIPAFLRVPGKKFLSIEPMLGPVEIDWCFPLFDHRPEYAYWQAFRPQDGKKAIKMRDGIDAVTLGGETGPGARPIHPDWARRVRDDCAAAGVPFLLKQMGEYELSDTVKSWTKEHGEGPHYYKVGRKRAGRLLDGREHNDMPWRVS